MAVSSVFRDSKPKQLEPNRDRNVGTFYPVGAKSVSSASAFDRFTHGRRPQSLHLWTDYFRVVKLHCQQCGTGRPTRTHLEVTAFTPSAPAVSPLANPGGPPAALAHSPNRQGYGLPISMVLTATCCLRQNRLT
jgi:hypothetical protein